MLLEPARFSAPADRDPLAPAAEAWGAARTWTLPHRAQAAVAACVVLRAARGRQVVVQRDVDPSIVAGLIVAGLEPHWLAPEHDPIAGVAHGVTPASLDAALTAAPGARAAIVLAPGMHGALPDVGLLAAVAHGHGAALLVDETLGPHLAFHPALPQHAIAAGASLVISRLGRLATLHQGPHAEPWLPAGAIERAVRLSGPPAPHPCAGPDDGERRLDATLRAAAAARLQLTGVPGVRILGPELVGTPGVAGFDPLRLTVDLHDTGRDARAVAEAVRERAGIEPALVTDRHIVVALGIDGADAADRFAAALLDTLWTVPPTSGPRSSLPPARPGPALCTPRAAWLAPQERVPAGAAVGRIATETLTPYPPGVPAVLPGERLEPDVIATLQAVAAAGGVVEGSADGLATFGVTAGAPSPRWSR